MPWSNNSFLFSDGRGREGFSREDGWTLVVPDMIFPLRLEVIFCGARNDYNDSRICW